MYLSVCLTTSFWNVFQFFFGFGHLYYMYTNNYFLNWTFLIWSTFQSRGVIKDILGGVNNSLLIYKSCIFLEYFREFGRIKLRVEGLGNPSLSPSNAYVQYNIISQKEDTCVTTGTLCFTKKGDNNKNKYTSLLK